MEGHSLDLTPIDWLAVKFRLFINTLEEYFWFFHTP